MQDRSEEFSSQKHSSKPTLLGFIKSTSLLPRVSMKTVSWSPFPVPESVTCPPIWQDSVSWVHLKLLHASTFLNQTNLKNRQKAFKATKIDGAHPSSLRTKRPVLDEYIQMYVTCNLMHNQLAKRPLTLLSEKNCLSRKLPCSFLFLICCLWSRFFFLRISGQFVHRRGCHMFTFIFWAGPDYYWRVEWNIIIVSPIVVTNLCRTRSINSGLNKSNIRGPIVRY